MRVAGTALLGLMCLAPPVLAGPHCRVPLGEWQPREALQAKLEQPGWMVVSIRVDDGCYKVRATPGTNAGKTAAGPSVSDSVAGTEPETIVETASALAGVFGAQDRVVTVYALPGTHRHRLGLA